MVNKLYNSREEAVADSAHEESIDDVHAVFRIWLKLAGSILLIVIVVRLVVDIMEFGIRDKEEKEKNKFLSSGLMWFIFGLCPWVGLWGYGLSIRYNDASLTACDASEPLY